MITMSGAKVVPGIGTILGEAGIRAQKPLLFAQKAACMVYCNAIEPDLPELTRRGLSPYGDLTEKNLCCSLLFVLKCCVYNIANIIPGSAFYSKSVSIPPLDVALRPGQEYRQPQADGVPRRSATPLRPAGGLRSVSLNARLQASAVFGWAGNPAGYNLSQLVAARKPTPTVKRSSKHPSLHFCMKL